MIKFQFWSTSGERWVDMIQVNLTNDQDIQVKLRSTLQSNPDSPKARAINESGALVDTLLR